MLYRSQDREWQQACFQTGVSRIWRGNYNSHTTISMSLNFTEAELCISAWIYAAFPGRYKPIHLFMSFSCIRGLNSLGHRGWHLHRDSVLLTCVPWISEMFGSMATHINITPPYILETKPLSLCLAMETGQCTLWNDSTYVVRRITQ
jgi:hypothetical protein